MSKRTIMLTITHIISVLDIIPVLTIYDNPMIVNSWIKFQFLIPIYVWCVRFSQNNLFIRPIREGIQCWRSIELALVLLFSKLLIMQSSLTTYNVGRFYWTILYCTNRFALDQKMCTDHIYINDSATTLCKTATGHCMRIIQTPSAFMRLVFCLKSGYCQ